MPKVSNKKAPKASYSPEKNYKWENDDEFTLSGPEFGLVYNTLKELALSPNGSSPVNIVASYNTIQNVFNLGVEQGVITEQTVDPVEVIGDEKK